MNFFPKGNIISILPKSVELSHGWFKMNLKYQEPYFKSRLFDESENGPSEAPPGRTNIFKKSVPDAPKLYVLQENKSDSVF